MEKKSLKAILSFFLLFLSIEIIPPDAVGATQLRPISDYSIISLTSFYQSYQNISSSGLDQANKLTPSLGLTLDIRIYRIFSLLLLTSRASDSKYSYTGAGFRVDLPGFFFFGAEEKDLLRAHKESINTSIHGEIVQYTQTQTDDGTQPLHVFAPHAGLTVDILPTSRDFYISLDTSVLVIRADVLFVGSAGLGLEL